MRPPGAPSQSIKDEMRASTKIQTTMVAASTSSSPRRAGTHSSNINNGPHHPQAITGEEGAGADYLSMSSIDVHCWPANSVDLGGAQGAGGYPANKSKTNHGSVVLPHTIPGATGTRPSATENSSISQPMPSSKDITSCLSVLRAKICWASEALEQNSCVNSSTELCNLIKAAAEAIVAVQKASI